MRYATTTTAAERISTDCLIVTLFEKNRLDDTTSALDETAGGVIRTALRNGDITGKSGQTLMLYQPGGLKARRLLLLGLGERDAFSPKALGEALAGACRQLDQSGSRDATLLMPAALESSADNYRAASESVVRSEEALYRFEQCKSEKKPPKRPLKKLTLLVRERGLLNAVKKGTRHGEAIARGMNLAKDLANLPGNICTPNYLAEQARKLARQSDKLKVTALTEKQMERLGMGALLSRRQGRQQARGAGGQGAHLRCRRYLAQAGRQHGRDEIRHVRRCQRHRHPAGMRRSRTAHQPRRDSSRLREPARRRSQQARRHRHQHGRTHHRDPQHRRRGTAHSLRCPHLRGALQARSRDRHRHSHGRLHRGPGPPHQWPAGQRREARGRAPGGRR